MKTIPVFSVLLIFLMALLYSCKANKSVAEEEAPFEESPTVGHTDSLKFESVFWQILKIGDESLDVPAGTAQPNIKLMLSASGHAEGFNGCNRFFGNYVVRENSLSFGALGSTRMYCVETADIENKIMAVLPTVVSFELQGAQLYLQTSSGSVVECRASAGD